MVFLLIAATIFVAIEETRGFGFILLALFVYLYPGMLIGVLLILGTLWLFR